MNTDDKARQDYARALFALSVELRNLGNEVLRPVRERPFIVKYPGSDVELANNGIEHWSGMLDEDEPSGNA